MANRSFSGFLVPVTRPGSPDSAAVHVCDSKDSFLDSCSCNFMTHCRNWKRSAQLAGAEPGPAGWPAGQIPAFESLFKLLIINYQLFYIRDIDLNKP